MGTQRLSNPFLTLEDLKFQVLSFAIWPMHKFDTSQTEFTLSTEG